MVNSGQLHATANGSELKISVQLPELGNVEVRAVTAHDITTAHLTASHPDALQLLSNGRAMLEQALNSRDVLLGSLDSRSQSSQHQHSQNQHSQPQGQPGGDQRQPSPSPSAQSSGGAASAPAATSTSVPAETGIANPLPVYSSISVRV
jgi:flagellar hook-length control protein FliK